MVLSVVGFSIYPQTSPKAAILNMGRCKKDDTAAAVDSSISLLKLMSVLIIFVVGAVIGLASSSHMDRYFNFHKDQYTFKNQYVDTPQFSFTTTSPEIVVNCKSEDCLSIDSFIKPHNLSHGLKDDELFWRASMVPQKEEFPFRRISKVAFMFMSRGPLPMMPLWDRFFEHQDVEKYSIYLHARPGFELNVTNTSVFYGRQIPSQHVEWGSVTMVDAEKRLLANALLDFSNERFVLLSESCIPLYNFPTVYDYLIRSLHSFVESYDDPSRQGRGRYRHGMRPDIRLADFRKGSQWFEVNRTLAIKIVSDTKYYTIFRKYCKPSCYPDEHYIPTYLHMFYGPWIANRTITYVDWTVLSPHPATYGASNVSESFLKSLRINETLCEYNSEETPICYLFARKFSPNALEPLLNLTSEVMGF